MDGSSRLLPLASGSAESARLRWCRNGKRSYPLSEVSGGREKTPGGREETPRIRGKWRPGGDTPCPRLGAARGSHLAPEAKGSSWEETPLPEARGGDPEEPPEPKDRGGSWEEPPTPEARASGPGGATQEQWLRRLRKA